MSSKFDPRSDQVCEACRKLKRRCDKALPRCGLCSRTGRTCQYVDTTPQPPTAAEFAALQARLELLEARLAPAAHTSRSSSNNDPQTDDTYITNLPTAQPSPTNGLPAALFLDVDCFQWAGLKVPKPAVSIPMEVLSLLAQGNAVIETTTRYFETIHLWMPIVSKKRIDLGIAVRHGGPDIAMLFLAMKLITSDPGDDDATWLYKLSKDFLMALELGGLVSQLILQAMVLVALYEHGHAIYPAAWMTVGACARYADLLGICYSTEHTSDIAAKRRAETWTEVEERRRICWAIFILDTLHSMGGRRPLSFPGLRPDGLLPVDDAAWDEGNVMRFQGGSISTPASTPQSPFARFCQAAMLMRRAIDVRRTTAPNEAGVKPTFALIDDLLEFTAHINREFQDADEVLFFRLLGSACLSASAIFLLLDPYLCPEMMHNEPGYLVAPGPKSAAELHMQERGLTLIEDLSKQICSLAGRLSTLIEHDGVSEGRVERACPSSFDALYCTMATFYWLVAESGTDAHRAEMRQMELCMKTLGSRWKLAIEYLDMLKHFDVTASSGSAN